MQATLEILKQEEKRLKHDLDVVQKDIAKIQAREIRNDQLKIYMKFKK